LANATLAASIGRITLRGACEKTSRERRVCPSLLSAEKSNVTISKQLKNKRTAVSFAVRTFFLRNEITVETKFMNFDDYKIVA